MFSSSSLLVISLAYFALLLGVAKLGDRLLSYKAYANRHLQAIIYSLSLGVFLTSWTFYGSVGRAATSGWDFLAPYIGPIAFFLFGHRIIYKIVLIAKRENIGSISDFISSRYGKSRRLAVIVTLMASLGLLPYIALQLKAIDLSYAVLTNEGQLRGAEADFSVFVIALLIGIFSVLFGARQIDTSAHNAGMVLAIAAESLIKLIAFVSIGLFATYVINDGFGDIFSQLEQHGGSTSLVAFNPFRSSFIIETLLALIAIICLPRQFHMMVVENTDPEHVRTARWLFPLYVTTMCVFMIPIAWAGTQALAGSGINADVYSLMLPMNKGQNTLVILAYIGGISAAMGMAAVSTIAISTMITNDIIMPFILHVKAVDVSQNKDLGHLLLNLRRLSIFAILLLAFGYYLLIDRGTALVSIGLSAFVAVAQFGPALFGGIFWRDGHVRGATAGLVAGFLAWAYCLLLPNLTGLFDLSGSIIINGPFGIEWLRPTALFGLQSDPISHATIISLSLNIVLYVVISKLSKPRLIDRIQADLFVNTLSQSTLMEGRRHHSDHTVGDLSSLLERFLGYRRTVDALNQLARQQPQLNLHKNAPINALLIHHCERTLSGIIGASSARVVVESSLNDKAVHLGDVVSIVGEAAKAVSFNRSLLQATIDNVSQGITVIDQDLNLVMWNHRYLEMFQFPVGTVKVGTPIKEIIRLSALQGEYGKIDPAKIVADRLAMIAKGEQHRSIRYRENNTVIEVRGNAMPDGGYVNTYTDISEQHGAEVALRSSQEQLLQANESLEHRVAERTETLSKVNQELEQAKAQAEANHQSKTRFLAAASHDLMQPLNAAKLFSSALAQRQMDLQEDAQSQDLAAHLDASLDNAEQLISDLIEISKLDGGSLAPQKQHFKIAPLLDQLTNEFDILCQQKGLTFSLKCSKTSLFSDPAMLRRVLQNFLTNAIRYTVKGKVLLGCRRKSEGLEIQVWDTGFGIPQDRLEDIFVEFKRLETGPHAQQNGIGLGLAIAQRTAHTLGHKLRVTSCYGQGSMFSILVPWGDSSAVKPKASSDNAAPNHLQLTGYKVLVIDNETTILQGMEAMMQQWGCTVYCATSQAHALALLKTIDQADLPDLILADYHLDENLLGTDAITSIRLALQSETPAIVITADRSNTMKKTASEAGFGLVHKPLKPAILRKLINQLR
ncbi:MAG: hybrid sensor histidine kinase/response regulator [Gammaproteobacteria bacterium]|nr:hybrid sensor histidine kinase/response regulator [Gammaproteobacteria bacterium]